MPSAMTLSAATAAAVADTVRRGALPWMQAQVAAATSAGASVAQDVEVTAAASPMPQSASPSHASVPALPGEDGAVGVQGIRAFGIGQKAWVVAWATLGLMRIRPLVPSRSRATSSRARRCQYADQ